MPLEVRRVKLSEPKSIAPRRVQKGPYHVGLFLYSTVGGGTTRVAAAVVLRGMKNHEEIEDFIMDGVRHPRPEAFYAELEARSFEDVNPEILEELEGCAPSPHAGATLGIGRHMLAKFWREKDPDEVLGGPGSIRTSF